MTFLLALLWSVAMPGPGAPAVTTASTIESRSGGPAHSQTVLDIEEAPSFRCDGHKTRHEGAVELGSLISEDGESEETSESPDDSEPCHRLPASDREALTRHHLAASHIPDPSLRDARSIRLRL